MSYRKHYSQSITVSGSKSYSYPASQSGGTGSVTIYIDVPINVEILVDTDPFDTSVNRAQSHLNVLTEAVIASEAAEVIAINEGAEKISNSIVSGFFSYIKYDISQQISEFRPLVETKFMELVKLHESCVAKKAQMTEDFARIAERYTHIFNDLDKEVSNRIKALNQEAFATGLQIGERVTFSSDNSLFNTATISNGETGNAFSFLFSSGLKQRTFQLIKRARKLLLSDKRLSAMLKSVLIQQPAKKNTLKYLPLIYTEIIGANKTRLSSLKSDTNFPGFQSIDFNANSIAFFEPERINWVKMNESVKRNMEMYLQLEIAQNYNSPDNVHANRVSEMILSLWNSDKSNILTN